MKMSTCGSKRRYHLKHILTRSNGEVMYRCVLYGRLRAPIFVKKIQNEGVKAMESSMDGPLTFRPEKWFKMRI